ncbi:alpha/beta fold hydrolase [Micromonospora eburnea]|uniref:Pimeloyl-ACP methyl ester carboxylesterase n=1 Tax=Micromonospora eburnea TaxID=227316 RepID=A0A1C6V8D2_9ACTN|nr:alpha/beta hydrolase [Micromonospora eburnea]SCL62612.1 Pimeloyl-ACP methyl ester carboxylesterase [Micromonospora eburnea]
MVDNQMFQHSQVEVDGSSVHVVEAGAPDGKPVLFLHGWPQSWRTWQQVMSLASGQARVLAIDLPGVGRSTGNATDGSKSELAAVVHQLVAALGLEDLTLVGHDAGGMVVYSYLRRFGDVERAVIMDTVIPGVDPWGEVLRNPYIWHFAFHSIPDLPERLVQGRQREYFDYFLDVLTPDPSKITSEARNAYAAAYAEESALTAGFSWYRTLTQDAAANLAASDGPPATTPLLYLRGEREGGRIADYIEGFRTAGLSDVRDGVVSGAGHFTQEENPDETWRLIAHFAGLLAPLCG